MATQAEIEAAAAAIQAIEDPAVDVSEFTPAARAALEAAERVRPHETSTERTRRHRAKKRAAGNVPANVPANVPSAGNVPANVPEAGNVPSVGNVPDADGGNVLVANLARADAISPYLGDMSATAGDTSRTTK